jgi:hypothetical protein
MPLLAYIVIKRRDWKRLFLGYFGLTLTNYIGLGFFEDVEIGYVTLIFTNYDVSEFYKVLEKWVYYLKLGWCSLLIIYAVYLLIKDYKDKKWHGKLV